MITIASLCIILANLNLPNALKTYFFDYDADRISSYVQKVIQVSFLSGILFISIVYLIGPSIIPLLVSNLTENFTSLTLLAISAFVLKNLVSTYEVYLQNARFNKRLIFFRLSYFVIIILVQVILIVFYGLGIVSVFWSMMLASSFLMCMMIYFESGILSRKKDYKSIKLSVNYGVRLIPFLLVEWMIIRGDRWLVQEKFDLETLGVYALTMNIAFLLAMVATAYFNGARPELYQIFKKSQKDQDRTGLSVHIIFFVGVLLCASFTLYLISFGIPYLSDNAKYSLVTQYLPVALGVIVIRSLIRFVFEYFECFKITKPIFMISVINLSIFLGLVYALPIKLGIYLFFISLMVSNACALIVGLLYIFFYNPKLHLHHHE